MAQFYTGYNRDANSWSVFEAGRKNEFGEPYCHVPLVTRGQAETALKQLQEGREVNITEERHMRRFCSACGAQIGFCAHE